MADKKDTKKDDSKADRRNADLDKGLGGRMFGGVVTGAQDHFDRQGPQAPTGG